MKSVVLGVTGSIAAYKACELARLYVEAGLETHVIMTEAATRFVTTVSLQTLSRNPVSVDLFAPPAHWMPDHISLADKADIMVVAPCTANVMAKLAHGLADDLLTSTALAALDAPLLLAPAMNTKMWNHPATQDNAAILQSRRVQFVDADTGALACGTAGKGRMAEPEAIFNATLALLQARD